MAKLKLQCAYLGIKFVDENGIQGCEAKIFHGMSVLGKLYCLNCFAHTRKQLNAMEKFGMITLMNQ